MEKYFKIGEISKLYGIGQDSIRYYEEFGVISPIRSESGYRLYSVKDIWRLNVIRDLLELGFSMNKIKEYLDCHNLDSTLNLLNEEKAIIDMKINKLKKLQKNVISRTKNLNEAKALPLNEIVIKDIGPRKCYLLKESYKDEHEMDMLIKKLINIDKERFYVIGNNQIGTFIPLKDAIENDEINYKAVFIIDDKGTDTLTQSKYLSVSYKGKYEKSTKWIKELLLFAEKNNLTPTGDILEILWVDIHTSDDIEEHITELQLPVK